MKNQYVPKTLSEYLGESKSITLKRKYGERPTITAGANAPLRNQVLSFVAESGSVSKKDLKQFILGLREGGSTPAAASMFIKRNAKYFLSENKNGITYFKLSNLGQRLVNQFVTTQEANVSERVNAAKRKLSTILDETRKERNYVKEAVEDDVEDDVEIPSEEDEEDVETPEFDVPEDEIEADEIDGEGPADEVDFEEDRFEEEPEDHAETDQFEYEEDDEKIVLTYYKQPKDEDLDDELEDEELEDDELEDEDLDQLEDEDEELGERPEDEEPREYDFKDKGRPGILGMDESAKVSRAQFVSHKLAGKKSPYLGGKLDKKLHNLLDDEDKDEGELDNLTKELTEKKQVAPRLGNKVKAELHNLLDKNQNKDENEIKNFDDEITESTKRKMMKIIENIKEKRSRKVNEAVSGAPTAKEFEDFIQSLIELDDLEEAKVQLLDMFNQYPEMHAETGDIEGKDKYKKGLDMFRQYYSLRESLNEAEELPNAKDELSDEDLKNLEQNPEETPEEETPEETPEEEVEKVEITEFIITVDDVDEAIDELAELGVTAERVPVEPKEEEIPAEVEEPEMPAEEPVEEKPAEEPEVKESLREAEEEKPAEDLDLGTSDELGLGDQGEDAPELEDKPEETVEPTTEFEENKIKVPADQWPTLKTWLEEKGVNISDMFGGEIEMEEVPEDDIETEVPEEPSEEISDDDISFEGIGEEDETKVKEE